jgi:hypothetical protein
MASQLLLQYSVLRMVRKPDPKNQENNSYTDLLLAVHRIFYFILFFVVSQITTAAALILTNEYLSFYLENTMDDNKKSIPPTKKSKGGVGKGSKRTDRPQSFWYALYTKFDIGDYKSQQKFLMLEGLGKEVSKMSFSGRYIQYREGSLKNEDKTGHVKGNQNYLMHMLQLMLR